MFTRLLTIDPKTTHSYFLFGPRGVGKTSWLKAHFPDALYFDLLKDEIYTRLLAQPNRLRDQIPSGYQGWIIIDEVQKIPALLDEVHYLIENRKLRFILTGSSARKLRKQGVNLLAGRALIKQMFPVTAIEQKNTFSIQQSLQVGHLPTALTTDVPLAYLNSYIATYLREEVMQEGLTRNIALFAKFLETASFSQGEMINTSEIAQDIATNRRNVDVFFDILEDLLLAKRLPVFTKRAKRETVKSNKFYYFDVGVYRAIRPSGPLDSPEELDGAALETLFLQEARAVNHYYDLGYDFYFWRTKAKQEVDFVLYGEKGLMAFEVKRKVKLKNEDFKGLALFKQDYSVAKTILLYGGSERYYHQDTLVMPFHEALPKLVEIIG